MRLTFRVSRFVAPLALVVSVLPAQETSTFRGDLAHTGVYGGPPIVTSPKVKWAFRTGGRIMGSAAVAGGLAYVGSTDGKLYAIDIKSGAERWAFGTDARVTSTPAVSGGYVYFGSYDGRFYAVDARSGKLRWRFETAGERRFAGKHLHGFLPAGETMPDPFDTYLSSPAVWRGTVYFGSGDGHVYALDAASGRVRWKFRTGNVVHASPAIADGTVYIGSWDSWFYALNATTGAVKWRFKTGEDKETANQVGMQSSAAVEGGVVYFGSRDAHLYALNAATGQKKWAFDTKGSWVITSPAVRNGRVYFATADSRLLYESDAATGAPIFSLQASWYYFASPALLGDMLFIGNWDGKLSAVDLTTRKVAWVFQTDSSRKNVAKYTKPDGSMNFKAGVSEPGFYDDLPSALDKFFTMGSFLASPVVVDGVIYIGSTDGFLYALK